MPSMIPAHVYGSKRRPFVATTLSGLIFCVLCPTSLQAVPGGAHKTDVELTEAVIGTWEALPSEGFSKTFLTFNADGTSKVIGMTNGDNSPRRAEGDARWRVNYGYLIAEAIKTTYHGVRIRFNVRSQIESIENGVVKLRDEKGDQGEMRRISHLPSLPPLLTPTTLTPEQVAKLAIYKPQPEYPTQARTRHIMGDGSFILRIQKQTGVVKDVQVEHSTGWSILDSAAISALKQWRFKPGALSPVQVNLPQRNIIQKEDYFIEVPIHFVMGKKT